MSNLNRVIMIQTEEGPKAGIRPPDVELKLLKQLYQKGAREQPDLGDRPNYDAGWRTEVDEWIKETKELANEKFLLLDKDYTLDYSIDFLGYNFDRTFMQRAEYGYVWSPEGSAPTPPNTSDFKSAPPLGSILVKETIDANNTVIIIPPVVTPTGIAVFGPPTDSTEWPGSYFVGATNSVPPGTVVPKNGLDYVYVELRRGFAGLLKLWLPTGKVSG